VLLRYIDDIFDTETATATIGVDFRVSPALLSVTKLFLAIFISAFWVSVYLFIYGSTDRCKSNAHGHVEDFQRCKTGGEVNVCGHVWSCGVGKEVGVQ